MGVDIIVEEDWFKNEACTKIDKEKNGIEFLWENKKHTIGNIVELQHLEKMILFAMIERSRVETSSVDTSVVTSNFTLPLTNLQGIDVPMDVIVLFRVLTLPSTNSHDDVISYGTKKLITPRT